MKRYEMEIGAINAAITLFNSYLVAEFHIPRFEINSAIENRQIVEILHGKWDDFPFPNSGTRGVYFLFGHEKFHPEKNGLYIGKASFQSSTSNRLASHLNPHRYNEHFTMNYGKEIYVLDFMASIDLDTLGIPFMASALEEHLILTLRSQFQLMNGTGN